MLRLGFRFDDSELAIREDRGICAAGAGECYVRTGGDVVDAGRAGGPAGAGARPRRRPTAGEPGYVHRRQQ